jgi:hypothetical protein
MKQRFGLFSGEKYRRIREVEPHIDEKVQHAALFQPNVRTISTLDFTGIAGWSRSIDKASKMGLPPLTMWALTDDYLYIFEAHNRPTRVKIGPVKGKWARKDIVVKRVRKLIRFRSILRSPFGSKTS